MSFHSFLDQRNVLVMMAIADLVCGFLHHQKLTSPYQWSRGGHWFDPSAGQLSGRLRPHHKGVVLSALLLFKHASVRNIHDASTPWGSVCSPWGSVFALAQVENPLK